jgi:hypothetical protein
MAKRDDSKPPKPKTPVKQPLDRAALQEKIRSAFQQAFGHEDKSCRYFREEKEK